MEYLCQLLAVSHRPFLPTTGAIVRGPNRSLAPRLWRGILHIYLVLLLPQLFAATVQAATNVILIVADDLGVGDLGFGGSTFHDTPTLDALATNSFHFTQAYASSPVCSPTRVALLTGQHPTRLGTTDWFGNGFSSARSFPAAYTRQLPLEARTLAEVFRSHGYATAHVGKWHLGGEGFLPTDQGFDINIGGSDAGRPLGGYFSPWDLPHLDNGADGEYLADRLTAEAIRFIRGHGDKPFYLQLNFYSPHTPHEAPADLVQKYETRLQSLPPSDEPTRLPESGLKNVQVQTNPVYAAMIERMDRHVAELLAQVDVLGLKEQTVFVFTSDHGAHSLGAEAGASNSPLRGGKGLCYEGGLRVPLLIQAPGRSGRTVAAPTTSLDLFPTLLELTGLPLPPAVTLDGQSLVPMMNGLPAEARILTWHYPHHHQPELLSPMSAIRLRQFKLLEHLETGSVELFDLETDPAEANNLAPKRPARVDQLRRFLHTWHVETGAKFPKPRAGWTVREEHNCLPNFPMVHDPQRGMVYGSATAESEAARCIQPVWGDWPDLCFALWICSTGGWEGDACLLRGSAADGVVQLEARLSSAGELAFLVGAEPARIQLTSHVPLDGQWHYLFLRTSRENARFNEVFLNGQLTASARAHPAISSNELTRVDVLANWIGKSSGLRVFQSHLRSSQIAALHGLERFSPAAADLSTIGQLLNWHAEGTEQISINGFRWGIAEVLPGFLGQTGGTLAGRDAWFVLADGGAGYQLLYPDGDADGMDDDWERLHPGLDPERLDAAEDFDGDGASNREEFLADTNPVETTNLPRIISLNKECLRLGVRPGRALLIEECPNLLQIPWQAGTVQYPDYPLLEIPLSSTVGQRYFRLIEGDPAKSRRQ